ncbi:hypothetical protein ABKN59_010826 [Abortiporus biennis]
MSLPTYTYSQHTCPFKSRSQKIRTTAGEGVRCRLGRKQTSQDPICVHLTLSFRIRFTTTCSLENCYLIVDHMSILRKTLKTYKIVTSS